MPRSFHLHLALLTTVAAQPADLVTIRGRVTNPITGQPRANVEMKLERDWNPITLPVHTNSAGRFAFPPVQREIWMMSAQAPDIGTVYYGSADSVNFNAFQVNPPDFN